MTAREKTPSPERLLTLSEVAAILSTSERFPRRLIEERRIRFVRIGRHVRIPDSVLAEFIAAGVVEPIITTGKEKGSVMGNSKGRRRRFGAVRELKSGQWQARYRGPDGLMRPADRTFPGKTDAEVWRGRQAGPDPDGPGQEVGHRRRRIWHESGTAADASLVSARIT
jgi:excisionase family DNA binding protein